MVRTSKSTLLERCPKEEKGPPIALFLRGPVTQEGELISKSTLPRRLPPLTRKGKDIEEHSNKEAFPCQAKGERLPRLNRKEKRTRSYGLTRPPT
jgi:hypothetical protein